MIFSHSRLSCFEQCPLKFKFKYIDKLETDVQESIEAFLGKRIHEVLEKLYRDLKFQKLNSLEELLDFFNFQWDKNWNENIIIVKTDYSPEDHRKMGIKFITDYYNRYKPFNDSKVLDLEKRITIDLNGDGKYKLQGYIDRLALKDDIIEIHDYKTNAHLPIQEYLEQDRQLALYALAVRKMYPFAKEIRLIWHFLAFDKEISMVKSDAELERLKIETIKLIEKIRSEKEFAAKESALCSWCEFGQYCPKRKHLLKVKNLPANEFLNEDGVKLVNLYAELKDKKDRLERQMEKIKEALFEYGKRNNVETIAGSEVMAKLGIYKYLKLPSKNDADREKLEKIIKEHKLWDIFSTLDTSALSRAIQNKEIDEKIMRDIEKFISMEERRVVSLRKQE